MIFDLDSKAGEWFPFFKSRINGTGEITYDEPEKDAGRVCVRSLVPFFEELQGKRKRKAEFVLNPQTRSMERVTFFDEPDVATAKVERDDAWDYCIVAWENFYDVKGKEIKCNRDNKLKLMSLPVFDRFIARCLQLLSESGVKAKEEAEKNVSTS